MKNIVELDNSKKVSILVPMYNVEKYISRCLKSLLKQTYENIEIIIVDDGSTDNSYNIAKSFADKNNNIVLYQKENEKNVAKTRNHLLSKIAGDYFVFVDSDDFVEKNYIKCLLQNMLENNSDCSCCNFCFHIKMSIARNFTLSKKVYNKNQAICEMILGKRLHFMLWNRMYKTKLLNNINFDENIKFGEDFVFTHKYTKNCEKVSYFNRKLYHYVIRSGSEMHKKFGEKQIDFLKYIIQMAEIEENNEIKNAILAWAGFSSLLYLFVLRKTKSEFKDFLYETAKEYAHLMKTNPYARKGYKFLYGYLKRKFLK